MTVKLNQIIAVVNGKKTQLEKALTGVYQKIQKPELFSGLSRNYTPLSDGDELLPSEEKFPQYTGNEAIAEAKSVLTELIDSVATQDTANTHANADVVVDGVTVLSQVPVTHLLFLEKQLVDLHTFVSKIPVLDPSERWVFDSNVNYYVTQPVETNRNKKVYKNHVKAEATDKHPAQVEVYTEDVKVGTWKTVKFSGAISAKEKQNFLKRVKQLQEAVKFAREDANSCVVKQVKEAEKILDFVFGE
jgi:hypothetical protein